MTRIFAIALTASAIALWAVVAGATDLQTSEPADESAAHSGGSFYPPLHAWPKINHDPAITRTLRAFPSAPSVAPQAPYMHEWQYQPALPEPSLGAPGFAIPKQGFYPREGAIPQAPGYEYDSGGVGTFPPIYPMEGANWRGPRVISPQAE